MANLQVSISLSSMAILEQSGLTCRINRSLLRLSTGSSHYVVVTVGTALANADVRPVP